MCVPLPRCSGAPTSCTPSCTSSRSSTALGGWCRTLSSPGTARGLLCCLCWTNSSGNGISLSLSLSLSISLPLSVSLFIYVSLSLSFFLCVCLSVSIYVCVFESACVCVCLYFQLQYPLLVLENIFRKSLERHKLYDE